MIGTDRLVPELFNSYGLAAKLDEHRLIAQWGQIVGPQIALHAMPREVRGRTLWVVVDSSTWLHELTLLKPLLLEKLVPVAGKAAVRDVRFVIGEVPEPEPPAEARPAQRPRLDPEAEAAVDRAVSVIADAELRESARRLLRKAGAPPTSSST